ncbi:helix-turn-helix domain-containing protein [Oricola thermophila]|uniref:Helix-turn-helix domain-containing protein n=1 Tax=Oricola thermophila TaxID=2742145 RepID=A0A6N1VA04_9HYPH|nr:helix-turn-helix domain-containing protein [Oricola thermophila]QKV17831.1 helix-turn-helix domain-containing protein [Oricola thermophila]
MEMGTRKCRIDAMNEKLIKRIEERLAKLNISATAASKAAGLSESFIRDLKKVKSPQIESLRKLASVLQVSVSELTGDEPVRDDTPQNLFTEDQVRRAVLAVMSSQKNRHQRADYIADLVVGLLNAQALEISDSRLRA